MMQMGAECIVVVLVLNIPKICIYFKKNKLHKKVGVKVQQVLQFLVEE